MVVVMSTIIASAIVFLTFGAFAVLGAMTVKRAHKTALKVVGYVTMVVFGFFAVILPLYFLWSFPASEVSETIVRDCEFFSSQQEAQHFLDKAKASDISPEDTVWWLDQDNDGIACEDSF